MFLLFATCKRSFLALSIVVAKPKITTAFTVELTNYGWSVQVAGKRVGLFQTQQQALAEVKRRRAELTTKRKLSSVEVVGNGPGEPDRARPARPFWTRR